MRTTSETSGTMLNSPIFESGVPEEEEKRKGMGKYLRI